MLAEPLYSEFAADGEMREILREFADGLGAICLRLNEALDRGEAETLRRLGHQLKGSGGGYGFPAITEAGATLEQAVKRAGAVDDSVRVAVDHLAETCQRALAGFAS